MLPSQEAAARAAEGRNRPAMRPIGVGAGSEPCTICQRAVGRAKTGLCPRCEKEYGGNDWCGSVRKPVVAPRREPAPVPEATAPGPRKERKPRAPRQLPAATETKAPPARSRARAVPPVTRSGSRRESVVAAPQPVAAPEPTPVQVRSAGPVLASVAAETRAPARFGDQLPLFGEEFWLDACNRFNASREDAA